MRGSRIYGDNAFESSGSYLYVNLGVVGYGFSVNLSFRKRVSTMRDILDAFRAAMRSEIDPSPIADFGSDSIVEKRMRYGETMDQARNRIWVEDMREFLFIMALFEQNAATWETGSLGTHGGDAGFILQAVAEHTDKFVNEYLRVNDEACS